VPDFEKSGGLIAVGGVVVAALGSALGVNRLGLLGMVILGVGIICWGLSGLIEKRILFFRPGVKYSQSYYGVAARAWGALLCLAGIAVAGFSALYFFAPDAEFAQVAGRLLGGRLGLVLAGLAGILYSLTLITSRTESHSTRMSVIMSLPRRVLGVIVLMVSITLTAAGMTSLLFPQVYEGVMQGISEMLPSAPRD
jgi:hypothetical protein